MSTPGKKTLCKVCAKTVYPADAQVNLDGSLFHKECAKCRDCCCQITIDNFSKTESVDGLTTTLFCSVHYLKRFNESGGAYVDGGKFTHQAARDKNANSLLRQAASPSYRSIDALTTNDIPSGLSYDEFASSFAQALQLQPDIIHQSAAPDHELAGSGLVQERRKSLQSAGSTASSSTSTEQAVGLPDSERRKLLAAAYEQYQHQQQGKSSAPIQARKSITSTSTSKSSSTSSSCGGAISIPEPSPTKEIPPAPPVLGFSLSTDPQTQPSGRKRNGHGVFLSKSGGQVAGTFNNDLIEGQCEVKLANGSSYVGQMKQSKFHGFGKLVSCHGYVFVGEFKEGKFNGNGKYTSSDGREVEGEWKNDELVKH